MKRCTLAAYPLSIPVANAVKESERLQAFLLHSNRRTSIVAAVTSKTDVWQGTLALMVLKTLERAGSLHGYGIARRIEDTSAKLLSVNYGTLYPALLKLEQEGYISSEWGVSDNNRKAKYYQLTRAGRKQIEKETREWEQMTAILARFLSPKEGLA
jgi:transcriptional regulator